MPSTSLNALSKATSPLNETLPATLQTHGLHCQDQTPSSAQQLQSRGQLNAEDFIETSPDIERTLMEAFIEDDYDGKLHLTTLSIAKPNAGAGRPPQDEIVGIAFWREVPTGEMNEWLDLQRLSKAIEERKLASTPSFTTYQENDLFHNALELVLSDSIGCFQNALQCCHAVDDDVYSTVDVDDDLPSTSTILNMLRHEWIKIELIAIKRTHRAQHLGRILMGCTLTKAHALHDNEHEHVILHIAGGGASQNIPAARLYKSYGFTPVPRHEEGGPFAKPDRDLCVLENIGMVLNALPWEKMLLESSRYPAHNVENGVCREEEDNEENCVEESCFYRVCLC